MKPFLFVVLSFNFISLSAQNFYINLQTGYGFATEVGQINSHNVKIEDNIETKELIYSGLGEGTYLRASVLYKKNNWVAIELGVNHLLSHEIVTTQESLSFFPSPSSLILYRWAVGENIEIWCRS